MSNIFSRAISTVLKHEGGFVNHRKDPGGATNLGVTKKVWEKWIKKKATIADMKSLTVSDVMPLYKKKYWDVVKGDKLPSGVNLVVFDFGVNAGPARAAKFLQRIVGTKMDGKIGPKTIKAVEEYVSKHSKNQLIKNYSRARRIYYKSLRHFPTFGRGWLRRTDDVERKALMFN